MGLITLGLCQIKVGDVQKDDNGAATGVMPSALTKIGKTYKDTAQISQEAAEVTEHFEEGMAAPDVRKKSKKIPKVTFSLMDADAQILADYVGGEVITVGDGVTAKKTWGYNGDELNENKAIYIETEQGLDFEIPNGDIEAIINADMSAKGIFLVEFTVTPLAVATGKKAIRGVPK